MITSLSPPQVGGRKFPLSRGGGEKKVKKKKSGAAKNQDPAAKKGEEVLLLGGRTSFPPGNPIFQILGGKKEPLLEEGGSGKKKNIHLGGCSKEGRSFIQGKGGKITLTGVEERENLGKGKEQSPLYKGNLPGRRE